MIFDVDLDIFDVDFDIFHIDFDTDILIFILIMIFIEENGTSCSRGVYRGTSLIRNTYPLASP